MCSSCCVQVFPGGCTSGCSVSTEPSSCAGTESWSRCSRSSAPSGRRTTAPSCSPQECRSCSACWRRVRYSWNVRFCLCWSCNRDVPPVWTSCCSSSAGLRDNEALGVCVRSVLRLLSGSSRPAGGRHSVHTARYLITPVLCPPGEHLQGYMFLSVLRCSLPEQPGDVRRDVHGGGAAVLRSPGAADVGVWTVWSLFSLHKRESCCSRHVTFLSHSHSKVDLSNTKLKLSTLFFKLVKLYLYF